MHIYVHIHIYIYIYMHTHFCTHVFTNVNTQICVVFISRQAPEYDCCVCFEEVLEWVKAKCTGKQPDIVAVDLEGLTPIRCSSMLTCTIKSLIS